MKLEEIIEAALAEDIGDGDHTTLATIDPEQQGSASLLVKMDGILCGVPVAEAVFRKVDLDLALSVFIRDGSPVNRGDIIFSVSGRIASILQSERLVLNFMQRMSGIATSTNRIVSQLEGLNTRILDTRKTTPLLRELEKYAVRTGGGENHRMGLYDMIMIKDNHVDFAGGIGRAIDAVHAYLTRTGKHLKIEVEVRNMGELMEVLDHSGVDRVMLDNFSVPELAKAVSVIGKRIESEASGGITIDNVRSFALTGVDYISVGAITHQIMSLDMSLKAVKGGS
jgi:nicotinate-nucleotide pyrophosphorylase (carboxylating)